MKSGQIAHLDHNNTNNDINNLVFLCFDHHDEYDSRTSQRKGLTIGEIKQFRNELREAIGKTFSQEVHFGYVKIPVTDPYAGQYIRLGGSVDSAEITLTPVPDGPESYPTYAVTGSSYWGTDREFGPNMGFVSFIDTVVDGKMEHHEWLRGFESPHLIRLEFEGEKLKVHEENWLGVYGMNVDFIGEYHRA